MDQTTVTLTSKGQLVIPAKLRRKHGLEAGTRIAIFEDPLGRMVLQPITEEFIDRITGFLGPGSKLLEEWEKEHREEGQQDKF